MTLLVTGGAGPMHAAALGRDLSVARVVIPPMAGLFSAFGMLATAPRLDLSRSLLCTADEGGLTRAVAIFADLEREAAGQLAGEGLAMSRSAEMRYRGQEHTVSVAWPAVEATLATLLDAFAAAHEKAYSFRLDGVAVELVAYAVAATLPAPGMPGALRRPASPGEARLRTIQTEAGEECAAVHDRDALAPGRVFHGPAVVEEATTTTLVLAGQRFMVDASGCLVIEDHA